MIVAQPRLESMLIVADAHRPYHDQRAWDLMLQVGRSLKPHHVIVNGDLADCYAVSSHSKDPGRKLKFKEELVNVRLGLDQLEALGAANYQFIAGNHEDRFTRFLADRAPELYGIVDVPTMLQLEARGWGYTPYKEHTQLGKLYITHDVGTAGRYATYKALDAYQHTIITGHTHRLSYVVEGNAVGEHKLSASFGWLGDAAKVDYMHRVNVNKNWALGFGIGHLNPATGVAYLVPVPIIKVDGAYTCMAHGRYFEN